MNEDDNSYILKKNRKTGNYSILKKINNNTIKRIRFNIKNTYLPYGKEEYNERIIINAIINNSNNINHNIIVTLEKLIKSMENLKDTYSGKYKYFIDDKTFFSFIKKIDNEEESNDDLYQLRLYMKYGAKVTHAKLIGELSYEQLKGKRCNLDVEIGSLWVNKDIMQYGINIYITHITVLN